MAATTNTADVVDWVSQKLDGVRYELNQQETPQDVHHDLALQYECELSGAQALARRLGLQDLAEQIGTTRKKAHRNICTQAMVLEIQNGQGR